MTKEAYEQMMAGLKEAMDEFGRTVFPDCTAKYYAIRNAIKLLTEQKTIVRCGDCKYYKNGFCYNPNTFDEKTCGNTVPDWFCADGKRRETDE